MNEEDIRGIYQGIYNIAEMVNQSEYTKELAWKIHIILGSNVAQTISELRTDEAYGLREVINKLDAEYRIKFRKLREEQKRLEAKI